MTHPYDPIRVQMKTHLRARKIRQKHVAAKAGISEKHMSQLLLGRVQGPLAIWCRVADAMGMRLVLTLTEKENDRA